MSVSGFSGCKIHSEAGEEQEKKGRRMGEREGEKEGAGGWERKKGRRHREKERPTQGSLESQFICLIEKSSSQESSGI